MPIVALQAVRSTIMTRLFAILSCSRITLDSCCPLSLIPLEQWSILFSLIYSPALCPLRLIAVPLSKHLGVKDPIRIRATCIPKLETFYKHCRRQPSEVRVILLCLDSDSLLSTPIWNSTHLFSVYSAKSLIHLVRLRCLQALRAIILWAAASASLSPFEIVCFIRLRGIHRPVRCLHYGREI